VQHVQHTGTRAATQRMIALAGRARRLKKHDRHHLISRPIVTASPPRLMGLEDLTHLRARRQRTQGKHATVQQRRANRHAAQWAFAEGHGFVA
jgi:putative transposase